MRGFNNFTIQSAVHRSVMASFINETTSFLWRPSMQSPNTVSKMEFHADYNTTESTGSNSENINSEVKQDGDVYEFNEEMWEKSMKYKYGNGNYALFRPLYKDLCDERRREINAKPPVPFTPSKIFWEGWFRKKEKEHLQNSTSLSESIEEETCMKENKVQVASTSATDDHVKNSRTLERDDTSQDVRAWHIRYNKENNYVIFERNAAPEINQSRIVSFAKIEIANEKTEFLRLPFSNCCYIEVFIERNDVILHYSLVRTEIKLNIRNVRAYDRHVESEKVQDASNFVHSETETESKKECSISGANEFIVNGVDLLDCTVNIEWIRTNLFYDGPFMLHLEKAMQNELNDIMTDHEITEKWVAWVEKWVYYLEHVQYLRWSVGMLDSLIPQELREDNENDFLTPLEQKLLLEPPEEYTYTLAS